jgi:hypothetical protein
MALSAERGLEELLPRMPSFVRKAKEIGTALARVDGVDVVPDPPQVAMLHIFIRGELERVRDAVPEIAKGHRTVIAGLIGPTALPRVQKTELGIGLSTLDVPTAEIAELYAELVERANSAPRRRRSARGASARGWEAGRTPSFTTPLTRAFCSRSLSTSMYRRRGRRGISGT